MGFCGRFAVHGSEVFRNDCGVHWLLVRPLYILRVMLGHDVELELQSVSRNKRAYLWAARSFRLLNPAKGIVSTEQL